MIAQLRGLVARLFVGVLSAVPTLVLRAAEPPQAWPPDAFLAVTEERIAALPATEQAVWRSYWEESQKRKRALPPGSDWEKPSPAKPVDALPLNVVHTRGLRLGAPASWYASAEAAAVADRIGEWQSPAGGWSKGIDYASPCPPLDAREIDVWSRGTLDNNGTTAELRFLARVIAADADPLRCPAWRRTFARGLDYLFASQYPNGGFPQVYPLVGRYHDAVTFNDSAMANVLELLRDVAEGKGDFAAVSAALRGEAGLRLARGIECVLASQIRLPDGRRTVWGQQHDPLTLRPCAARNFEPISASTAESAGVVEFLMSLSDPSPGLVAAVDAAVAWFERTALPGLVWDREADQGSGLRPAPGGHRLWARMVEIGTDRPVFGDRDRSVHFVVTEVSRERRLGYAWYGSWPADALAKHSRWKARLAKLRPPASPR